MFTIFKEEKVITTGILVFLGLSILVRLLLAGHCVRMWTCGRKSRTPARAAMAGH